MASPTILTRDTLIPIGSVLIVVSAAITSAYNYGKISTKVDTMQSDLTAFHEEYAQNARETRNELKEMAKSLNELTGKYGNVSLK